MAAADFDAARARVPAGYAYFNNQADDILAVGAAMMRGEMAYHAGETESGFNWLREAVAAEDRLVYTEPRAWMHPPRHALGALLLEQGRIDEARVIYERDLGHDDELPVSRQNRGNVWSLSGLVECYEKIGRFACRRCRDGACRGAAAGGPACDKFMFLPRPCWRARHGLTRLYL